jgi:hypothetical protein
MKINSNFILYCIDVPPAKPRAEVPELDPEYLEPLR